MDALPHGAGTEPVRPPTLLFDGACNFCRAQVRLGRPLLSHALALRPLEQALAEFPEVDGLAAMRAIALAEPDGTVHYGAEAIARALEIAGWPLSARLYRQPRLRPMFDRGYAWVAKNRYHLAGAQTSCADGACRLHAGMQPEGASGDENRVAVSPEHTVEHAANHVL